MIDIVAIDTPTLGDRSYLVTEGERAFMVDPRREASVEQVPALNLALQVLQQLPS
jgi:hypothetical protein